MNNNNFKNYFKNRLLIVVSGGLFIACLCVMTISIWPLYNHLKDLQTNKLIFAVKTKSMLVSQFLEKARETSKQITSRSKAREFLEKYNSHEVNLATFQNFSSPILHDALNLSEFAVGINRLDIRGKPLVQVGIPLPVKFLQPFNVVDNEPSIKEQITIGNNMFIVVSAPIINRQKLRVGTDIILFTASKLSNIIQDYSGLGKGGETVLGRTITNGQSYLFFPIRSVKELQPKSLQHRHLAVTEQALRNTATLSQDKTIHLLNTTNDLVAYASVEGTDWVLIVRMDKSELFGAVTKNVLVIILVIIALVIPLGVLGLIFLLRPLSNRILIHVETLQQEITSKEKAIHKQKILEEKLQHEKERLSVTLRSIGDGVITTDLKGHIVFINKIAEQLTGWIQDEAKGKPLEKIFHIINENSGQRCNNPVQEVLRSRRIINLANHTALVAKDGTKFSIEDSGAPIFDQKSEIIGTILVFRDVTTKKKNREELLKVKKLESIGVLAGGIAHDFNNILAAILGNIELAGMSIKSTEAAYPLLQEAKKASLRAKALTQQLLTFSKGGEPVKKTVSIGVVITESANFVLHGSSVSCQFNIPHDLWLVDIDSGQISQVIQNLIINAKQAMPDGGKINIECSNIDSVKSELDIDLPDKRYVKIVVKDTGCGIAEKYSDKVFDPYFTTKQEGSGLGLAISNSIITNHDGYIGLKSKVAVGTTFIIYLAASCDQILHVVDEEKEIHEIASAIILIMDDDELVQKIVKQMILHLGHKVLLTRDGTEAIKIFTEYYQSDTPINAVIMDLTIPGGMGGKDAIKEMLKIDPDVRAIVSSGYSNDPLMSNYQKYGFKAAMAKPYMISELTKVLADVLK